MPYWFDANNLIGQSAAAARADSRARSAFLAALSGYRTSGGGRFLVYFDGDAPDRSASPPGILVRYSAPLSTDQAILQRLKEIRYPSEIIVVTNDLKLKALCRDTGAAVLTWAEFTSKRKSKPARRDLPGKQPEPVDVEDWMRYFGFHKTNLP